jgi:hypothetical protein
VDQFLPICGWSLVELDHLGIDGGTSPFRIHYPPASTKMGVISAQLPERLLANNNANNKVMPVPKPEPIASVQICLDKLVELFHKKEPDTLDDYAEAVALLKSLTVKEEHRSDELHQILERKVSDLLTPFAARLGALPGRDSGQYEDAFRVSLEWVRCYYDPLMDQQVLLEESETLAMPRQPPSPKRSYLASLKHWLNPLTK